MPSTSFRTAVLAGTCALALSLVAAPAWAAPEAPVVLAHSSSATAAVSHGDDDAAEDESADDSRTGLDDRSVDDSDVLDSDVLDDTDDDGAADTSATPVEQGRPALHLGSSTISPVVLARRGVTAVASGLTPGVRYQPFWRSGSAGDDIKGAKRADAKGTITFRWKPGKERATGTTTVTIGVRGVGTAMADVTQTLEVRYASDLTWQGAVRHGRTVTLTASVDREAASGGEKAWKKVPVAFQRQDGDTWTTVRVKRTNGEGVAKVTVRSDAATVWRAIVDGTATVAGTRTKGHRR